MCDSEPYLLQQLALTRTVSTQETTSHTLQTSLKYIFSYQTIGKRTRSHNYIHGLSRFQGQSLSISRIIIKNLYFPHISRIILFRLYSQNLGFTIYWNRELLECIRYLLCVGRKASPNALLVFYFTGAGTSRIYTPQHASHCNNA